MVEMNDTGFKTAGLRCSVLYDHRYFTFKGGRNEKSFPGVYLPGVIVCLSGIFVYRVFIACKEEHH